MSRNIIEGAEFTGEGGKTYLAVCSLGQENVWTAVDKINPSNIVVLKSPSADDTSAGWPRFQHEMVMHELFKSSDWIRRQVDRIPASHDSSSPPILVLEITETTLWDARSKRPFTKGEIQAVGHAILQGLRDIHAKGLVYADLKMQNIMISGFDVNHPGDGSDLVVKLGDLGIVMAPSMGKVQPVAYRAPEVQLKFLITEAADIWGFALIYCHLLEAQTRFSKTGLYDDLSPGNNTIPQREQAIKVAITNDYDLYDVEYYQNCALPWNDPAHAAGEHWEELKRRGLDDEEIELLKWVLKADPTQRPTASAILQSKWFDGDGGGGTLPGRDTSTATGDGQVCAPAAQVKKRKHSDQPLLKSARDFVVSSAAPFLPWLTKSEITTEASVPANTVETQVPVLEPSEEEDLSSHTSSSIAEDTSAAPFLPWLHASSGKKEDAPALAIDAPPDTSDCKPHQTSVALQDNPLVDSAVPNQDDSEAARSDVLLTRDDQTEPNQTSYLGQQSSSSGTYLSYRPG